MPEPLPASVGLAGRAVQVEDQGVHRAVLAERDQATWPVVGRPGVVRAGFFVNPRGANGYNAVGLSGLMHHYVSRK